jgi:hypothetical protein
MVPSDLDGAFHATIDAVVRCEIPESRIDESVRKILETKAAVELDKNRFVDLNQAAALASKSEDIAFAQEVADKAVTLVRHCVGTNGRRNSLRWTRVPRTPITCSYRQIFARTRKAPIDGGDMIFLGDGQRSPKRAAESHPHELQIVRNTRAELSLSRY